MSTSSIKNNDKFEEEKYTSLKNAIYNIGHFSMCEHDIKMLHFV